MSRAFIKMNGLGNDFVVVQPGPDPFDPSAPLIFCLSPLVGTPLTTSAKFAVLAKSPLTYRLNDALSSSHFALAGKRAGLKVPLEQAVSFQQDRMHDLVALDVGLTALEKIDPRKCKAVELRSSTRRLNCCNALT